nr:17-beta-hydroxysteroid dehydrogenase type 6-like protein [Sinonovacula constricta]
MCPMLCMLPILLTCGVIWVVNRLLRRRTLPAGGKAVFITGCDRGFGETLASQLALEGYIVYAGCLDPNSDGARILHNNSRITVLHVDVTNQQSVNDVRYVLEQQLADKGLWAVVNNAGVAVFAETEWCTMEAYERVLGVNLLGTIRVSQALLPLVRKARGRLINISSLAGRVALPGFTAYSASKFGVIGFSDSLRREMFKFGVKVITIEPKLYRTAIADSDFHAQTNQRMWTAAADGVKVDYGDTYFRAFIDNMLKNLKRSSRKTYQVTDDLMHATSAKYPYTRYVPNAKIQVLSDMFMVSSNLFQDYVLNRLLRVPCVPFSMRSRRPT